jgi:hypothetical protein
MASLSLPESRLTRIDYPDTTVGPTWEKNSCWIDAPFWLAKVLFLGQTELDETVAPVDEERRKVRQMLDRPWKIDGVAKVKQIRDDTRKLLEAALNVRYGARGPALAAFWWLVTGLPTLHLETVTIHSCERDICQPKVSSVRIEEGLEMLEEGLEGRSKDSNESRLARLVSAKFARYWLGRKCKTCHHEQMKQLCTKHLPDMLVLNSPIWTGWADVSSTHKIRAWRPPPSCEELGAAYRCEGLLIGDGAHFTAAVIPKHRVTSEAAAWYDDMEQAGRPVTLDGPSLDASMYGKNVVVMALRKVV